MDDVYQILVWQWLQKCTVVVLSDFGRGNNWLYLHNPEGTDYVGGFAAKEIWTGKLSANSLYFGKIEINRFRGSV